MLIRLKSDIPLKRISAILPDGSYRAEISGDGVTVTVRVIEYYVTDVEGQEVPEMFCLVTDLMDWRGVPGPASSRRCISGGGTGRTAPRGAVVTDGGERPSISPPSQRRGEAGGSLSRGSPGRAGAASTKSRRPGTAGWAGRGERDGKVHARNRCCYAS